LKLKERKMSNNHVINKFFPDMEKVIFRGKSCLIAQQVGRALGYGNKGVELTSLIAREWVCEFIEGKHYEIFYGKKLVDFKKLLTNNTLYELEGVSTLFVLYEPGVYLVCLLAEKPFGDIFRRWVIDKVPEDIIDSEISQLLKEERKGEKNVR
jgi:prophage antirepressor-like protein